MTGLDIHRLLLVFTDVYIKFSSKLPKSVSGAEFVFDPLILNTRSVQFLKCGCALLTNTTQPLHCFIR